MKKKRKRTITAAVYLFLCLVTLFLIWVNHDLMDMRVVPKQSLRDDVNRYMRSVLREEPLDPSLEIIDDAMSW